MFRPIFLTGEEFKSPEVLKKFLDRLAGVLYNIQPTIQSKIEIPAYNPKVVLKRRARSIPNEYFLNSRFYYSFLPTTIKEIPAGGVVKLEGVYVV